MCVKDYLRVPNETSETVQQVQAASLGCFLKKKTPTNQMFQMFSAPAASLKDEAQSLKKY